MTALRYFNETRGWSVVGQAANPVDYGADPTGVADSAPALRDALAASSWVQFPAGTFKFNSAITYNIPDALASVRVSGAGVDNTILLWPNATNGIVINYLGAEKNGAHINDCTFATGAAGGGNAIILRNTISNINPGFTEPSDITRVGFRGFDGLLGPADYWIACIDIENVSNVDVIHVTAAGMASGANGIGVYFQGLPASSTYAVAFNVDSSLFINLNNGLQVNSFIQGIVVSGCNFTGGNNGILIAAGQTGSNGSLNIVNSQFNDITSISQLTVFDNIQLCNNIFIPIAGQTSLNWALTNSTIIVGNIFYGAGNSTGVNIGVTSASGTTIINDNNFFGGLNGVVTGASSLANLITNNSFRTVTNPITNNSTDTQNVYTGNIGYNPVGVTAAANVGVSPATITAGPSPETHYLRQTATNTATIAKGGQQIATLAGATTYYPVELGPNESYVVTWGTTQPTYTKDVH